MSEDADNSKPEVPGKPFKKGVSGNPGGAPKWLKAVRESLRRDTPLARRTLRKIMKSAEAKDADKIAAAKVTLDFTVPKPKQTHRVEGNNGDPLAALTPEQLVAFVLGRNK